MGSRDFFVFFVSILSKFQQNTSIGLLMHALSEHKRLTQDFYFEKFLKNLFFILYKKPTITLYLFKVQIINELESTLIGIFNPSRITNNHIYYQD